MKKALAILLTLVLVFGLAVPVFAAKSPNGQEYHKVIIIQGNGHKNDDGSTNDKHENITHTTIVDGNKVKVKSNSAMGKFNGWTIYKADGTLAVEGVDYRVLGAFSLTDSEIEIIPLTTIVIAANYNDEVTQTIIVNDEEEAPPTGDSTVVVLSAVALIALCGVLVSKKQLAK